MNALKQLPLQTEQLEFYKLNGYLLPQNPLFSEEKFSRLKGIFEELIHEQKEGARSNALDTPHFRDDRLMDFLFDEQVLDVVESIIGPDFGLWSSHFICKEPKLGRSTPWHEDSSYWKGRFDNFDNIVTIWLAIDPSTKANGCMKVIPESHLLEGDSQYVEVDKENHIFDLEIADVDESRQVYFELQPNHYSLHDSRIIHGAESNRSDFRRCGFTMRYFSQNMKFFKDNKANEGFKIWHCRGLNPHSNIVEN